MLKTLDIVLIAVMISAAAWTYKIKHEAETLETQVAKVERRIALERETIIASRGRLEPARPAEPAAAHRQSSSRPSCSCSRCVPTRSCEPDELPRRAGRTSCRETGGNLGG